MRQQLHKPCLILIMGVAGSGKTALAKEVLRRLSAVYLDNNHIVDAFFPDARSGRSYEKLRPRFYEALYTITEKNLRVGNSVLLDVPHIKEVQTRKWQTFVKKLARSTKAKLVVIRCLCSGTVLRNRISRRGERRDRWKLKHWNEFLTREPINVPIPFPHLDLNTEKSLLRNTTVAIGYIRSQITRSSR